MTVIENIKTGIGFVLDNTDDAKKAMEDGKFTLRDSLLVVDNINTAA